MRYSLWTDALFWTVTIIYFINRFFIKPHVSSGFFHEHLNDLICIPMWLPIMVALLRLARVRPEPRPPDLLEVVASLVVWSIAFEFFLPTTWLFESLAVSDYRDLVFYSLGGLIGIVYWRAMPYLADGERR